MSPDEPAGRRIEVRCPVPVVFRDGTEHASRLFVVIHLSPQDAGRDHSGSGLEFACGWCLSQAKKSGQPVRRILHQYTLDGEFQQTLTDIA